MNYGKIPLGVLVTFGALETQAMAMQQQYQMQRPQAPMAQAGAPHSGEHAEHAGSEHEHAGKEHEHAGKEHAEHSGHEGKKEHSEHSEHAGHEHGGKKEHSGKKESGEDKLEPVKKELLAKLEENKSKPIRCAQKDGKPHTIRAAPMIVSVKKEETKVEKEKGDFDIQYTAAGKKMHIVCPSAAFED